MCEQREQLVEYLYDEASKAGRRDVERHLESCGECRDEIRAFRSVREDLLAWGVPNPPAVWTAFAPAPALPWHKQMPAWALAAAASLMFLVGSAGGFVAHNLVDGSSGAASASVDAGRVPAELTQTSLLDSKAILSLIHQELANSDLAMAGRVTPASNTPPVPFQLDPKVEARLLTRMTDLVNASQERQLGMVGEYLYKLAQEDDRRRRDDGRRFTLLTAQVEQLEAQLRQLTLAQAKGQ